ncbi:MAG TPA: ABC transporter permease [Euzebya sp.]|nr:ABC transporter permease [Euzebya sp.]
MTVLLAQTDSLTSQALGWFRGEQFSSVDGIPQLIAEHLAISAAALGLACLIALPSATLLAHAGKAPVASINAANAFRAIPAFGLLLVAFVLGGFSTTLMVGVFAVIGIAPIFANTYVGIRGVDRDAVDAAVGMGLTDRQVLIQVEIPLATPVILAGVRTSAVNIVATVSLAAYVGFGGLGVPIFAGLSRGLTRSETAQILAIGGSLTVAAVSMGTEALLAWLQRSVVPVGLRLRDQATDPVTQVALERADDPARATVPPT